MTREGGDYKYLHLYPLYLTLFAQFLKPAILGKLLYTTGHGIGRWFELGGDNNGPHIKNNDDNYFTPDLLSKLSVKLQI